MSVGADRQLSLLHTRLSIIDLDPRANQPFKSDGCVLIHNGEIYNYVELRQELERRGHVFHTQSDTEVIVKAYRSWGGDCVERFEGMWAFALFDTQTNVLFLSRDRFGEKPLFICNDNRTFAFASEVHALSKICGRRFQINGEQVRRFLVNGYKSIYKQAVTFFEDVWELPPATNLLIAPDDDLSNRQPQSFWQLKFAPKAMSQEEALEGVKEHLFKAVGLRLRSDVPVAFCLSGGVDSSTLAAIAVKKFGQDITTFSIIDSDPRYNEGVEIQRNLQSLGCRGHLIETSTKDFLPRLRRQCENRSAPVATISYYVHAFISEAVREKGFKVAVSGTAADELFTGYYDHYNFWLAEHKNQPDFAALVQEWKDGYGQFVRNPVLKDPLCFAKDPTRRDHIYLDRGTFNGFLVDPFSEDFFETNYCADVLRNRMLNELWNESVPVMLKEDDQNSMRNSVENRSPFLDSGLAEFLFQVPTELLIGNGLAKWLLREASKGLVPEEIRMPRMKRGFNASIDSLLDRGDKNVVEQLLSDSPIFDFVQRESIQKFLNEDLEENSMSKFMFSFASAKMFLDHWSCE